MVSLVAPDPELGSVKQGFTDRGSLALINFIKPS
jgi:hypothetical protein